ncbi:MAG: alpha/beta hydrolase [Spirochaetales bacterium]|nr:alpha/beta hydrolase [Spirochaetales bacterium]
MIRKNSRQHLINQARLYLLAPRLREFWVRFKTRLKTWAGTDSGRERIFKTPFGPVRTLCFGLKNDATLPLYIDLHGGGFIMESAEMDSNLNRMFYQELGCKIISIDYPKAPAHPYPAAVNKVSAVVKEILNRSVELKINTQRIIIGGHSAGANLAAACALKFAESSLMPFSAVLLDYPILDLSKSPYEKPFTKGAIPPHLAEIFDACYIDPSQAKDPFVSPLYAPAALLKAFPATLIIAAGMDSLYDEAVRFSELLENAGAPVEFRGFEKAHHGFTYGHSRESLEARQLMCDFMRRFVL